MDNPQLNSHITFLEYLSHRASMTALAMVDVPVVLLAKNYPHVVPQKLYNYLALNKPILAVVPPDGRAAEIVRETNSGIVVSPDNSGEIAACLLELHKKWEKGPIEININEEAVNKYRRDLLTKKLVSILNRHINN